MKARHRLLLFIAVVFQVDICSAALDEAGTIKYIEQNSKFEFNASHIKAKSKLEVDESAGIKLHLSEWHRQTGWEDKSLTFFCFNVNYVDTKESSDGIESHVFIHRKQGKKVSISLKSGKETGISKAIAHLCSLRGQPFSVGDPFN